MSERDFLCNPLHYVEVMRHRYSQSLVDWCCVELSHVLEFSGTDSLGQVLMGNVDIRQGKTITRKFTRHRKKASALQPQLSIFGAPLSDEGYSQARLLIDYLKDHVEVEGLFRIPGNSHRQQRLKDVLNQGRSVDLESSEFTPHDVACVLKSFLSELPEPLLTDRHYEAHIQAAELTYKLEILPHHTPEMLGRLRATRTTSQVTALRYLFLMLQPCTYKLLRELTELLHTVAENEGANKMNASSLGILLAPHILWPRFLTTNDLKDQVYINKLNYAVKFIISYCHSIFKVPENMLRKCEIFVKNGGKLPEDADDRPTLHLRAQSTDDLGSDRKLPIGQPEAGSVAVGSSRNCTEEALAQLYASVQSMPESSKKRKLMKQFVQSSYLPGTPTKVRDDAVQSTARSQDRSRKHRRSRSAGDMLVKQLGTPFRSHKKRLAPNPPPQKVSTSSSSSSNSECQDDLCYTMNDLNRLEGSKVNTPGTTRKELNIPTPAPRTPGSHRRNATPAQRSRPNPSSSSTNQNQQVGPPTPSSFSGTPSNRRPVLKPHSDNITPTRKAPTAPPKKYSPYIPPPKNHSSPKDMDCQLAAEPAGTRRGVHIPPPRNHSSPKEYLTRAAPTRQSKAKRTPVPAPRTSTPPVASGRPLKRRSDGTPIDGLPTGADVPPTKPHRPVAKPRVADKKYAIQTAV